jgi:succinyl-CoA synthetase alpha subunit
VSILLDETTRVCVVGITGGRAAADAAINLEYGTRIVAGVAPGRAGQDVAGVPVYDTCADAAREHEIDAVIAYLPPRAYLGAMRDALAIGPQWVHAVTEGIPLHDNVRILQEAREAGIRIIGPNTSGIISPGRAKVGFIAHASWMIGRGRIGILSRSGGFTHDLAYLITQGGLGVSTVVPIGGDAVVGQSYVDLLELFEQDDETDAVVIYGEAGPPLEAELAQWMSQRIASGAVTKPVVALVAGDYMERFEEGTVFGHAGAFLSGPATRARAKREGLRVAGAHVVDETRDIVPTLHEVLGRG